MDDFTLVNKCLKGDTLSQKALFEKFAPKMMFVCLRYCKEQEDAEDTLQEGFIKVFNNLNKYQNNGSLEGWIRKIVVNTCLDFLRKNKKNEEQLPLDQVEYKLEHSSSDDFEVEELLKMINELPQRYRVVFNLFAIEGYTHKEIAEKLSISEDTSKSQYFRARTFLMNKIKEKEKSIER